MPANYHIIISQKSWTQRVKHLSDDSFVLMFQLISFFKAGIISAEPRSIGQIPSSTIQFIRSVKYGHSNSDELLRIFIGMWVDALFFLHD